MKHVCLILFLVPALFMQPVVAQQTLLLKQTIGLGGSISKIATGARRENIKVSISGDGNWLAYTLEQENYNRDLLLLNFNSGTTAVVTDGTAGAGYAFFNRMLIDQDAGSGGDFLPYSFRQLGIGKLIGTRTWGGLIGIFANPLLMDGGVLTVPF